MRLIMSVLTGINPAVGPPKHGTLRVQTPKGDNWASSNYKISTEEVEYPSFEEVNAVYDTRFDDV
jgi:hypothetical protein